MKGTCHERKRALFIGPIRGGAEPIALKYRKGSGGKSWLAGSRSNFYSLVLRQYSGAGKRVESSRGRLGDPRKKRNPAGWRVHPAGEGSYCVGGVVLEELSFAPEPELAAVGTAFPFESM